MKNSKDFDDTIEPIAFMRKISAVTAQTYAEFTQSDDFILATANQIAPLRSKFTQLRRTCFIGPAPRFGS